MQEKRTDPISHEVPHLHPSSPNAHTIIPDKQLPSQPFRTFPVHRYVAISVRPGCRGWGIGRIAVEGWANYPGTILTCVAGSGGVGAKVNDDAGDLVWRMSDETNDMIQILTTVIDHLEDAQDTARCLLRKKLAIILKETFTSRKPESHN